MKRSGTLIRRTPLRSSSSLRGAPIKARGVRGKRRDAEYAAFRASPAWKGKPGGIRWQTFLANDFTCQCGCGWRNHSETGAELDADHVNKYAQPFGQERPGVDVVTKRRLCHRRKHWYRRGA